MKSLEKDKRRKEKHELEAWKSEIRTALELHGVSTLAELPPALLAELPDHVRVELEAADLRRAELPDHVRTRPETAELPRAELPGTEVQRAEMPG